MSVRPKRVASEIQKVLSANLLRLPAFLTILEVEVTKDLSIAKIYFSLYGDKDKCAETFSFLESNKRELRREIGQKVKLRIVPELQWIQDDTPARADRIRQLLLK